MHGICVLEVTSVAKEGLKALFSTRNNGCVVAEQQATENGNHHN